MERYASFVSYSLENSRMQIIANISKLLRLTFRKLTFENINIRLPDSWYMMLITVIIALTTFFLDKFIAQIFFWQVRNVGEVELVLKDVNMYEYKNNKISSFISAPEITMKSVENIDPNKSNDNYEFWKIYTPVGISENSTGGIIYFNSGRAQYQRQKDSFELMDGVELFELSKIKSPNAKNFISINSSSANYDRQNSMITMKEKSLITQENNRLNSEKVEIDLKSGKMVMEKVQGVLDSEK